MSGPYSTEEIEEEIYLQVVDSNARAGELFPGKYVMLNMEANGYTRDDFQSGIESLTSKGLITDNGKISDTFLMSFAANSDLSYNKGFNRKPKSSAAAKPLSFGGGAG